MRPLLCALLALSISGCGGTRSMLKKGDAYFEDGRYTAAVRYYERVLEKKPGEERALIGSAQSWVRAGEPERAIVPATVAAERQIGGAAEVLAEALVATGRGKDARDWAERAVKESPNDPGPQVLLAEARLAAGDVGAALSLAEEALSAGGQGPAASLAAWLHARKGNCTRGISLADRASSLRITDAGTQGEAAAVFRLCGDEQRARATAAQARGLYTEGPADLQRAAVRRAQGGDQEGAIRLYARLRTVWADNGRFARDLGFLWLNARVYTRAAEELSAALKLSPYSDGVTAEGIAVVELAANAMGPDERKKAIEELNRGLADAMRGVGDPRQAARAEQLSVETRRGATAADWLKVAEAWDSAGDPNAGLRAAEKALEIDGGYAPAHAWCARLYARALSIDKAIGHARVAWEILPADIDNAVLLMQLYDKRNEDEEAQRVLAASLERAPRDQRLLEMKKKLSGEGQ
jgi:tetratricopeptide (TPR) repeat protein